MKNPLQYHSALKANGKPVEIEPRDYVKFADGSIAFQHDIVNGLPAAFDMCDLLYAEPAWKMGMKEFNKRAGINSDYYDYYEAISRVVESTKKPTIIMSGKQECKLLPNPLQRFETKINNHYAVASVYHFMIEDKRFDNNIDMLEMLSRKFNCVGDFSCGYGNTAAVFRRHRKRFVMTDYNAKCIGFIAETFK